MDLHRNFEIDVPHFGDWAKSDDLPCPIQTLQARTNLYPDAQILEAKRASCAPCTQIDHQIRCPVWTLRLEGILDDTIILFTSGHGDMLGIHGMVAKRFFYESSASIAMILMANKGSPRVACRAVDDRLVGFADVMPTLLDLASIDAPGTADDVAHGKALAELTARPLPELHGPDHDWLCDGILKGRPDRPCNWAPHRSLYGQRGDGWPPVPVVDIPQVEWTRERDSSWPGNQ